MTTEDSPALPPESCHHEDCHAAWRCTHCGEFRGECEPMQSALAAQDARIERLKELLDGFYEHPNSVKFNAALDRLFTDEVRALLASTEAPGAPSGQLP